MLLVKSLASIAALLAICTVQCGAAEVKFFTVKSCDGTPSDDYQGVSCNSCVDPAGGMSFVSRLAQLWSIFYALFLDWEAGEITGISSSQRWSAHNEVSIPIWDRNTCLLHHVLDLFLCCRISARLLRWWLRDMAPHV